MYIIINYNIHNIGCVIIFCIIKKMSTRDDYWFEIHFYVIELSRKYSSLEDENVCSRVKKSKRLKNIYYEIVIVKNIRNTKLLWIFLLFSLWKIRKKIYFWKSIIVYNNNDDVSVLRTKNRTPCIHHAFCTRRPWVGGEKMPQDAINIMLSTALY